MIFLSDRNLFSTDLYLADARDGKIIRKINSILRDGNIDDYNFLESAGTWSPKSDRFAFVAFTKGRNAIIIKDPETGSNDEQIHVPGVSAIAHPSWSPDGEEIAFSGMVEGQTDLFIYNFKSKKYASLLMTCTVRCTRIIVPMVVISSSVPTGKHLNKKSIWSVESALVKDESQ